MLNPYIKENDFQKLCRKTVLKSVIDQILDATDERLLKLAQPAIFIHSMFTFKEMYKKIFTTKEKRTILYAGHSLGEYSALCAANVFDIETGLRLVIERMMVMEQAAKERPGCMLAINRFGVENYRCSDTIDMAAMNSKNQIVLSGLSEDMKHERSKLDSSYKVTPLKVAGPFHSRYMQSAAKDFNEKLNQIDFNYACVKSVFSNVTGNLQQADDLKENLTNQLISPVKWRHIIDGCLQIDKNAEFIEIGHNKVLSRLNPGLNYLNLGSNCHHFT